MIKKITTISAVAIASVIFLTGCTTTSATTASENVSTAADNFEVQRQITGINGITDKPAFYVEGRCSITDQGNQLEVMCKHGDNDYRKHFVGLSDNVFYVAEQMESIDVSVYHTRILIKPEALIPEFNLDTGKQ